MWILTCLLNLAYQRSNRSTLRDRDFLSVLEGVESSGDELMIPLVKRLRRTIGGLVLPNDDSSDRGLEKVPPAAAAAPVHHPSTGAGIGGYTAPPAAMGAHGMGAMMAGGYGQPPAPQPLGKAAKRAGIFAAVEAEESMEAQRLDDRQAQYAELREAEKELLDACRLARDVSGGAVGPSRSTELELMLADVGRELRRLEDLGVRPLAW